MCFWWGLQNAELVEILGGGDEVSTNGLRVIWDVVSYIKSVNTTSHIVTNNNTYYLNIVKSVGSNLC